MKAVYIVLALIPLISPVFSRKIRTHNEMSQTIDFCVQNCSNGDTKVQERLSAWKFQDDAPDRCYIKCAWAKIGQKSADGKVNIKDVKKQFTDRGVEIPIGTDNLANDEDEESLFLDTIQWVAKNRKAVKKAYHFDD